MSPYFAIVGVTYSFVCHIEPSTSNRNKIDSDGVHLENKVQLSSSYFPAFGTMLFP